MRRSEGFALGEPSAREREHAFLARILAIGGPLVAVSVGPAFGAEMHASATLAAAEAVALLVIASILRNQYLASEMPAYGFLGLAFGFAGALAAASAVGSGSIVPLPEWLRLSPTAVARLFLARECGFLVLCFAYVLGERLVRTRPNGRDVADVVYRRLHVTLPVAVATVLLLVLSGSHDVLAPGGVPARLTLPVALGLVGGSLVVLLALTFTTRLRRSADLWLSVVLTCSVAQFLALPPEADLRGHGMLAALLESAGGSFVFLAALLAHVNDSLIRTTRTNREVAQASVRDPLTELYNARGFEERLAETVRYCSRSSTSLALALVEIDDFARYEAHYGRAAADRTLRSIAAAIAGTALRPLDSGARLSEDSFALVLPETDVNGGLAVATRVRDQIRRYAIAHAPGSGRDVITVSIGVASAASVRALDTGRLVARAEAALYEARHGGRDRIHLADVDDAELPPVLRIVI